MPSGLMLAASALAADQRALAADQRAAVPISMSRVSLHGGWKAAQDANREVLMGLNSSRLTCHFTTTANLTACADEAVPWHTYTRTDPSSSNFTGKLGFLAAGDDARAPAELPFDQCEATCAKMATCLGFSFQAKAAQPVAPVRCYFKNELHFTPSSTQGNCVAPGGEGMPICSPLPGEMGLGGYYGHYQGHWLSATAFLVNATGNQTVAAAAEGVMRVYERVMAAWKAKYGDDGYLFPYDPLVWDQLLAGHGAYPYFSVPFYTLHKLMAGLLDQHTHAGSALALTLVTKMAGWVARRVDATIAAGGQELWQKVLLTEWGGMNDVLYGLHAVTGDADHLRVARLFNAWVFTAPLSAGVDDLATQPFPHANFHLPEVVGNARAFELTANATDAAVVHTFFDALTANHSYATGGSNSGECWQQPRDLGNFLSTQTEESCTQYNVLKVARHLFQWGAEPRYADFYERAILNGIVGNQKRPTTAATATAGELHADQQMTSYIYMLPLGGAQFKAWGKSDYGFPCCWGTLSESFAKLSDSIFFASADGTELYVNQFVSATVDLSGGGGGGGGGATLSQLASDLTADTTSTLTFSVPASAAAPQLALRLRVPGWLPKACAGCVLLNGRPLGSAAAPGTYLRVPPPSASGWSDGDALEMRFTPSLWTDPLNDYHAEHNATLAFMYGPLVLAGVHLQTDIFVPRGGTAAARADPSTFIVRNSSAGEPLEFAATSASGETIKMIPLRDVTDERYVVYFMTAGTKPPQPTLGYCPHSAGAASSAEPIVEDFDEQSFVSAGPPSLPPSAASTDVIHSRGVTWAVHGDRMASHAPSSSAAWTSA